jgi:cobalt transporter subunit CbtA
MDVFRRLFVVAALAGLISGVFVTVVHQVSTVPVILNAEIYETASAPAEPATDAAPMSTAADGHDPGHDHEHDEDGWRPADGFERTAFTLLADVLTGIGFALLLVSAYSFRGRAVDWRAGLFWGLAGFVVFTLAPDLGLPPEVPGTEAAPLLERQLWWVATAALTAAGLGLIVFGRQALWAILGIVLIVLPHAWGAPQPAEYQSVAPESLAHRFVVAATVTSLLFWAALGLTTGFLYGRIFGRPA